MTDKRVNARIYKHNESAARRFIKKLCVGDELVLRFANDVGGSLSEADQRSQRQLSRTYVADDQLTAVAYIGGQLGDELAGWVTDDVDDGTFRAFAEASADTHPRETFRVRVIGGEDITGAMIDEYRDDPVAWKRAQNKPRQKRTRNPRPLMTPDEEAFAAITETADIPVESPRRRARPSRPVEPGIKATDAMVWIAIVCTIGLIFLLGFCIFSLPRGIAGNHRGLSPAKTQHDPATHKLALFAAPSST